MEKYAESISTNSIRQFWHLIESTRTVWVTLWRKLRHIAKPHRDYGMLINVYVSAIFMSPNIYAVVLVSLCLPHIVNAIWRLHIHTSCQKYVWQLCVTPDNTVAVNNDTLFECTKWGLSSDAYTSPLKAGTHVSNNRKYFS